MQYKMLEMHIYEIDYPKARNVMSTEEMSVQRAQKMKALGRFVTNPEPEPVEADLSSAGNNNIGDHQGYEQSYPQDDQQAQYEQQDSGENQMSSELDALIDADQDMQQVTRKQRHG